MGICAIFPIFFFFFFHFFFFSDFHFDFLFPQSPLLITMSDDESIFPNQSVSQIESDERSRTGLSRPVSENTSNSEKTKSIGAYLIAEDNPACLLEIEKYLDKASVVFILTLLYYCKA